MRKLLFKKWVLVRCENYFELCVLNVLRLRYLTRNWRKWWKVNAINSKVTLRCVRWLFLWKKSLSVFVGW